MKITRTRRDGGPSPEQVAMATRLMQLMHGRTRFGYPTRCPGCANYGMVDRVDEGSGVQRNHCPVCFGRWTLTAAALQAVDDRDGWRETVAGGGVLVDCLTGEADGTP